ncbi:MAG TPA: flavin reductase family protein [Pseudomonadales bacterium]|nr:flavin reductase family protein [Pseudomonadales bacterium]
MTRYDLTAEGLRAGMRRLAASVCVITARDSNGQRQAMTATAVTSVSDNPASLLVCVNRQTTLHTILAAGGSFAVNVLGADQADISVQCASVEAGEARFSHVTWSEHHNLPYLPSAQAVFFCDSATHMAHGTHLIVVGNVREVLVSKNPVNPLLYADGRYGKLRLE